jgi:hypothetical protein
MIQTARNSNNNLFLEMTMLNKRPVALTLILSVLLLPLASAQPVDDETRARIRKEGMEHSQIMKTMHMLSDVYGPRLTGSPNHKRASEWTIKQMQEWGVDQSSTGYCVDQACKNEPKHVGHWRSATSHMLKLELQASGLQFRVQQFNL